LLLSLVFGDYFFIAPCFLVSFVAIGVSGTQELSENTQFYICLYY